MDGTVRALVAILLLTLLVSACGPAPKSHENPVALAADTTAGSHTVRLDVLEVVTPKRGPAKTLRGGGEEDIAARSSDVRLRDQNGRRERDITIGDTIYVSDREVAATAHLTWAKLDFDRFFAKRGIDIDALLGVADISSTGLADQIAVLRLARAGTTTRLGTETIGGVGTTHYRVRVDLRRLPDLVTAPERARTRRSVQAMIRLSGRSKLTYDVWVDGWHRLRRLSFGADQAATSRAPKFVVTYTLHDYGLPVHIAAPPAGQVKDITDQAFIQR
jgi:hypothetical protein